MLEFVQACAAHRSKGKRIAQVRADRAVYPAELFNGWEEHTVTFAIGGVQETAVQTAIAPPDPQWYPVRDGALAETVHGMAKTKHAFRLIVLRRPLHQDLFTAEVPSL